MKIPVILMLGFTLMSAGILLGHNAEVGSRDKFYKLMERKAFAVGVFFEAERHTCNSQALKHALSDFKALSTTARYRAADVQFLEVNLQKDSLALLKQDLHFNEVPVYLLFAAGQVVKDDEGELVALHGWHSREQVHQFIEENLQDELDNRMAEKAEERERCRKERLAYGPYFYYGYGVPWWNSWGYPLEYYPYYPCPYCW